MLNEEMDVNLTITTALITGVVTSVHCIAMCGPLACTVTKKNAGEATNFLAYIGYHGGRLISYGTIGALCGALGEQPLTWIFQTPAVILPWALVAVFLITALGLWKQLPRPRMIDQLTARMRMRSLKLTAGRGGFMMGLATPLLPCGPLYLLFGATLLSGNAVRGAEFAIAFGLGTVPLLWVAQHTLMRVQNILPRFRFQQLQRGLAVVAAVVMMWRLHDTLPQLAATLNSEPVKAAAELPSCCP